MAINCTHVNAVLDKQPEFNDRKKDLEQVLYSQHTYFMESPNLKNVVFNYRSQLISRLMLIICILL